MSGPVTFDRARREAYRLLGDAGDWMGGLPHTSTAQAIDVAKTALNDAANAAHQARPAGRVADSTDETRREAL